MLLLLVGPAAHADEDLPKVALGLGKGLEVKSADGGTSIKIRARIQARLTMSSPTLAPPLKQPQTEFAIRRMRLLLTGSVLHEFVYYIQLGFSNQDMEPDLRIPLRDAYVTWTRFRDANVRFGQMKAPYGLQRIISSSALQMADRSVVTNELNLDRDVGVTLRSDDLFGLKGRLAYAVGVFGGDGRNRLSDAGGVMPVVRAVLRPMGEFDDDVEADHDRSPTPHAALGLSAAYNNNSNRDRSTLGNVTRGRTSYGHVGADFMLKWRGLSLQSEVMWRNAADDVMETEVDGMTIRERTRSAVGAYMQAGTMLGPMVEVVVRYSELWPLNSGIPDLQHTRELGGGINFYLFHHSLKLQTDYFCIVTNDRWRDGSKHQVRVQFQLYL